MEKKRKKKGGSNWEKNGENEKKINCPFDDKKVCPVTIADLGQTQVAKSQ